MIQLFTLVCRALPVCALLAFGASDTASNGQGLSTGEVRKAIQDLQEKISQDRRLDGVLLSDAFIDKQGQLAFRGIRPKLRGNLAQEVQTRQTDLLKSLIEDYRKSEWQDGKQPAAINLNGLDWVDSLVDLLQGDLYRSGIVDVLITRQYYAPGTLHFEALIGNDRQQEDLQKSILAKLELSSSWRIVASHLQTTSDQTRKPETVHLCVERVDLQAFLARLQGEIASLGEQDANRFLDGTRLDRAYFNGAGQMTLEGIVPTATADQPVEKLLLEQVRQYGTGWVDGVPIDLSRLIRVPSPLLEIRALVSRSPELDGTRVDRVYYNANGEMVLSGIQRKAAAGQSAQSNLLLAKVQGELSAMPEWKLRVGKTQCPVANLAEIDFDRVVARLHEQIRTAVDDASLTRVRIDRLHYDPKNTLVLEGIRWNLADDARNMKFVAPLVNELSVWPMVLDKSAPPPNVDGIVHVANPIHYVRELVANCPALDGVRIDYAYYDGTGQLHFHGAEGRPDQASVLSQLLAAQSDNESWRTWAGCSGWQVDPLDHFAFDDFLRKLRRLVAQEPALDGTRIDRAFYDKSLQMAFQGQYWKSGPIEKLDDLILASLQTEAAAGALRQDDGRALTGNSAPDRKAILGRLDRAAVIPVSNLSDALSGMVELDCHLDGTRLDRVYYDENNQLQIEGLLADDNQQQLLPALLAQFAGDPVWGPQIVNGFSTNSMRVQPIAPLLQFVKNVMPAYGELDGAEVVRAFHACDGRLAFEGRVLSEEQRAYLQAALAYEIWQKPAWRIRLVSRSASQPLVDVGKMTLTEIPTSWPKAMQAFSAAKGLYKKGCYREALEQLNLAMTHYQREACVWCYRALCYIALGEMDLARRDLRRIVAMEKAGVISDTDHDQVLAQVQGPQRDCFEQLRLECLLHHRDGTLIHNACYPGDPCQGAPGCRRPCCPPSPAEPVTVLAPAVVKVRAGCSHCGPHK